MKNSNTFYFYDLETSGINPRNDRVMQFAGQRTNENLQPIGDPHNILIKLTPDILPDPRAILITGITPQRTVVDGVTEREFLEIFFKEIATPHTIFVGFNNIRFDDEFIRCMLYRNFHDAYEWHWKDGRSRWDLLDALRMTRALRPDGITWPVDDTGIATNRLELITKLNGIVHAHAHDALSDVMATISVAQLLRTKQPKIYNYLLHTKDKKSVSDVVGSGRPFLYTSGKYDTETEKTTAVANLGDHPNGHAGCTLVYDLRYNPIDFLKFTDQEAITALKWRKSDEGPRLPVKILNHNKCPAIAPLSVLDEASQKRLKLDVRDVNNNFDLLQKHRNKFYELVARAYAALDAERQRNNENSDKHVDAKLYDGFFSDSDKTGMSRIRTEGLDGLEAAKSIVNDSRLKSLLPLYKARNFPDKLSAEEHESWEAYRRTQLFAGEQDSKFAQYFESLRALSSENISQEKQFLLEELQLYGQSIMPDLDN